MNNDKLEIAIDGGAGTGKTTVGQKVAAEFGLPFCSTGQIFRVFALRYANKFGYSLDKNLVLFNKKAAEIFKRMNITLKRNSLYLNDKKVDVSLLNNEKIANLASKMSSQKIIRKKYEEIVNAIVLKSKNGIVLDGRDIGTRILTRTPYKFFLTCDIEEQAKRRAKDYNDSITIDEIKFSIHKRDHENMTRELSPLVPAQGAFVINTTTLNISEVVDVILKKIGRWKIK